MYISRKLSRNTWIKIIFAVPLVLFLYFLFFQYNSIGSLSATLQEPKELKTFIDDIIPFFYIFLFPYLIWFFFPVISLILAIKKTITLSELTAMFLAHIFLILSSFVFYLLFPTTAESVMVDIETFTFISPHVQDIVRTLYSSSVPYNAFPSYHVAPMVFISLFLWYEWKKLFWYTLPLTVSISLATVFVKYHVFADILGGIAMGVFAYYVLYKKLALPIIHHFIRLRKK